MDLLCVFFKQKTAYEMRISDWSSDVCSSDLEDPGHEAVGDALDVMRTDLAAQDGLRLGRLHREQPHVRVDSPEGLADADQRAAGAHAHHQRIGQDRKSVV